MRLSRLAGLSVLAALVAHGCAKGSTTIDSDDDGAGASTPTGTGVTTTSSTGTGTGTGTTTTSSTGTGTTTTTTSSTGTGTGTGTTTTTTSTGTTTTTTSTSTGACDPFNPAAICGANMHCVPQSNGVATCEGPVGAGTPYSTCADRVDCGVALECVSVTGVCSETICMQWCTSYLDCGMAEDCYYLDPAVYIGGQEWGVCYDCFCC